MLKPNAGRAIRAAVLRRAAAGRERRHDRRDGGFQTEMAIEIKTARVACRRGHLRQDKPARLALGGLYDKLLFLLAGVAGLEPATPGFGDRCSSH